MRVIELAILGLLMETDLHGYELKKRLRDLLGPLSSVSFGSLYPALTRLERRGAVKAVEAASTRRQSSMPMTGSLAGEAAAFRERRRSPRGPRNKKVYGITASGRSRLADLLAGADADDRSFALKLAFCRWCDPTTRMTLLERRRAALVERLAEGRRAAGTRLDRADRYVRSLMEHGNESTVRDIAWLDRLIETERASQSDGPEATTGGNQP